MRLPRRYTAKALPSRIVPVVSPCTSVGCAGPEVQDLQLQVHQAPVARAARRSPSWQPRSLALSAHEATTATVKPLAHHTTRAQRFGMRTDFQSRSSFCICSAHVVRRRVQALQWTTLEGNRVHADIRHLTVASVSLERTHSFSATSRLRSRVFEARFRQACQIKGRTPLPSTL